ncbi:MAG TPA: ribonuclease J [Acidimicrobiales bacterium]|nr:ribonuclease J [Acidimicrobiales bacterium]
MPDGPGRPERERSGPPALLPARPGSVRIVFLGGLGEIGRNCACIEVEDRIMLLDCGLMFPDTEMPGIDLVLPDFTYLRENADRVEGCIVTHGHEDHCGALSYLLRELQFPIYGSALTLGLARSRIEESGLLGRTELITVRDGERRQIGPFDVEFIPVTHSVPHGFATAFHTPQGVILHTGDFKIDLTPVDGRSTDLARIGALADGPGIRLLLSDSTNAEEEGHTDSERRVGRVLADLFAAHPDKRVVMACFASHIHRVQQIAEAAIANGRTIATLGRSMARNVALARQMGLLRIPDESIVDIERIGNLDPRRVCIISTGSQGEPMSALALMAAADNKWIKIGAGDLVVLSSHAIPGNETNVGKVIDGLSRLGAEVVHSGLAEVHVSGHAKRDELKTILSLARPECFIPVHGEFRHLSHHARLAEEMGVDPARILLAEDGDVVDLTRQGIDFAGEVPAGYLYVDGIVGDVGQGVLRDRRVLAEEGVVIVVVTVDAKSGEVLTGPEIITRGWVYAPEAEELLGEARQAVLAALEEASDSGSADFENIRRRARQSLGKFVSERTRRRPMIVPVVMEV